MISPHDIQSHDKDSGWHTVFVAVGANMGDKLANCHLALDWLVASDDVADLTCSPFYRTAPVDYLDQDWFVNGVMRFRTCLSPGDLLDRLKDIESRLGRETGGIRFGPRPIDLDIIFYADRIVRTERLEIPHMRMHKRRFVLQPICDIDPAFVHPVFKQTIRYLLDNINDPDQEVYPLQ